MIMKVELAYGQGNLTIELPESIATVLHPAAAPGLPDEAAAVRDALEAPLGALPLRQWIRAEDRVCLLFTDATRATPNERLVPWLCDYLAPLLPRENLTLVNQTGTHRTSPHEELERHLTPAVVGRYRVVNHDCQCDEDLVRVGTLRNGAPARLNRRVVEADKRIVTGFIEPHFFAGFSGGPKGLMPGVAALETVVANHGAHHIRHPRATFGITEGNPLWEELRDIAGMAGPSFLVNVTLNEDRQITNVFAGDLIQAHRVGCDFVRKSAMQTVPAPFDIVVTTNSGHPLDLNFYQGVKGISAGARILKDGGLLILACECREGIPNDSPMDRLYREAGGPEGVLARIEEPDFTHPEQWQAQILAQIQRRVEIQVFSSLAPAALRPFHLEACNDIESAVRRRCEAVGSGVRVALLPQGPLTIPCLP